MTKSKRHPRNAAWKARRQRLFKRQKGECHWCGCQMVQSGHLSDVIPENLVTLDHVIPRSEGGSDRSHNLVAACNSCNSKRDYNRQKGLEDLTPLRESTIRSSILPL